MTLTEQTEFIARVIGYSPGRMALYRRFAARDGVLKRRSRGRYAENLSEQEVIDLILYAFKCEVMTSVTRGFARFGQCPNARVLSSAPDIAVQRVGGIVTTVSLSAQAVDVCKSTARTS